ncbi:hypothetical protein FI667_g8740, partial [Globisporangium splendens]
MSHERPRRHLREYLPAADYDTAVHVVESIRRKALSAAKKKEQKEANNQSAAHDEEDDGSEDGADAMDNNSGDEGRIALEVGGALRPEQQSPRETPSSLSVAPTPVALGDAPTTSRHESFRSNNKHVEALRIPSQVELHRSTSGRNLRLKHISQTSKEALSPHALTPRAPSGKQPTERPSSSSSSSYFNNAKPSVLIGQPRAALRSSSMGSSSSTLSRVSDPSSLEHDLKLPTASPLFAKRQVPQLDSQTPASNNSSKIQERRSSFTISEHALKEMGFSRSAPRLETVSVISSIRECNQSSDESLDDQLGALTMENEDEQEEKEKSCISLHYGRTRASADNCQMRSRLDRTMDTVLKPHCSNRNTSDMSKSNISNSERR